MTARKEPLLPGELEAALRHVARDYEAFVARGPAPGTHEDAKSFSAHHAAGRAALAHLEQLLKLARGREEGEEGRGDLLAEARRLAAEAERQDRMAGGEGHDADA